MQAVPNTGPAIRVGRATPRSSLWARMKPALVTFAILNPISLFADDLVEAMSVYVADVLGRANAALIEAAGLVQPWAAVAILWQELTTWPADMSYVALPAFLLGRLFGGSFSALLLPLSGGWATVLLTLVGYGLGLLMVAVLWERYVRTELPLPVAVVATVFAGSVCLWLLQALMLLFTGIGDEAFGTRGGGVAALASLTVAFGFEFGKHLLFQKAEAEVEHVVVQANPPTAGPKV